MFCIEAMNGPFDGKRWSFDRDIAIGRDERIVAAALPTDRAVSRRHADVTVEGSALVLRDLGSSNGTIVDGQTIEGPVRLEVGQPFLVGRTLLRVLDVA
ncbi:MAG TPA: FHA domain-containing protein [Candidatus Eremiobacteraceae bacterium]|nr:FHA domain-containing protein [Candidatus Eremiobacteraceae bacterium]